MQEGIKKILLILIWWLAAILLLAASGWIGYYFYQYPAYQNNQYHFTIRYPKGWKKIEHYPGTAMAFVRPKQSALELFQPNATVTIQEVPSHLATLTTYSDKITQQMKAVFQENINILENKSFKFGNRPGHRMIIEAPEPQNVTLMIVWTIKNSMAYVFTFTARTDDQYKQLFPTAQKMLASFEFK